jgi:hypothetical protein
MHLRPLALGARQIVEVADDVPSASGVPEHVVALQALLAPYDEPQLMARFVASFQTSFNKAVAPAVPFLPPTMNTSLLGLTQAADP